MFGFPVPQEIVEKRGQPVRYWGARAIFKPYESNPIDLLPDRQSVECQDDRDPKPLIDWLNKTGLRELKSMQDFKRLTQDGRQVVEFHEGQFTIMCCPNASYGYLYIGAWQYYPEGCQYELKTCPEFVRPTLKDKSYGYPDEGKVRWSNLKMGPPPIGAAAECKMNGTWLGTVTGYFVEHGFLGFEMDATERPEYHKKQSPDRCHVLMFGTDLQTWSKVPEKASA